MRWNDMISESDFRGAERWPTWICTVCQQEKDYYLTGDICDQCGMKLEEENEREHQRRLPIDVSESR